jgi:lysozyme
MLKPRTLGPLAAVCLTALTAVGCAPGDTMPSNDDAKTSAEGIKVCPGSTTLKGIDVSEHNATINWSKVKASGRSFAIARVSDGVNHPDVQFAANWSGIKAQGLVRGAYQYFRPGQDPLAQADLMVSRIGTLGPGDLPPVIDVETADGYSGTTIVKNLRTWIDRVKLKTGVDPIIYAAQGFWDTLPSTAQFAGSTLWVANYGQTCPHLPKTWGQWKFWQSSESGTVPGVTGGIDLDVFNGTLAQLTALAGGSPAGATCATDADCNHGVGGVGAICSNSGATAGQCIDGCHASADCLAGGTCDQSQTPWECDNAVPALGTPCTSDADCSDGQAGTGRVCGTSSHACAVGCHVDGDCPSGAACDKSGAAWVCKVGPTGPLPLGAACTSDAQCGGPGAGKVCGSSSHVCTVGCHADTDCTSGQTCDKTASSWKCAAPQPGNGCPVLSFPSGIHIQTYPDAATTASYTGHLQAGEAAPLCFLDVGNLHDPVAAVTYDLSVKIAAHFQLTELVGTEVNGGWGNFVLVNPTAVASLEAFRVDAAKAVTINSGFRSPKHQESVCNGLCGDPYGCAGTCSNHSRHMWGDAFDLPLAFYSSVYTNIACDDGFKFTYLESGTHLHIDQNPAYPTCVMQ